MPTPAVSHPSAELATQHKAFPMSQTCANCEELIAGTPYQADGEAFCCVGCALGGPCQCTYSNTQPVIETSEHAAGAPAADRIAHSAAGATTPPASVAAEQPLAWPATTAEPQAAAVRRRPAILRVAGLTHPIDLLRLGSELEQQPEIEDLSLVRSDLDDAWFAVTVLDADALADALVRLEGFDVDARPHPAGVDATVTVHAPVVPETPVPAPPVPAAVEARRDEPHARPRFRVFRRPDEVETPDESQHLPGIAAQPAAAPPPPPAPVAPAASAAPAAPSAPPPPPVAAPAVSQPAARQQEPAPELISADARPGGAVTMREHITLVVYPFRSFVALNEFQDAIRALRGVVNVKVRRFYRGTLHLGVEYEDVLPLTERMRDLEGFAWRLVSSSPQEIELMLEEQGDLVSSG